MKGRSTGGRKPERGEGGHDEQNTKDNFTMVSKLDAGWKKKEKKERKK